MKLTIPAEAIHNLEVLDEAKTATLLLDFFTTSQIQNKKILIILDDSILFEKTIPLQGSVDLKAVRDDFVSKVPLGVPSRSVIELRQEKQMTIYATNRDLYQSLIMVCKKLKNKVLAVTPAAGFGLGKSKSYSKETLDHLFKEGWRAKDANFLPKM